VSFTGPARNESGVEGGVGQQYLWALGPFDAAVALPLKEAKLPQLVKVTLLQGE